MCARGRVWEGDSKLHKPPPLPTPSPKKKTKAINKIKEQEVNWRMNVRNHATFCIVSAGLHWSLRISRQIPPFELMLLRGCGVCVKCGGRWCVGCCVPHIQDTPRLLSLRLHEGAYQWYIFVTKFTFGGLNG